MKNQNDKQALSAEELKLEQRIDDYLTGKMDDAAMSLFEQELFESDELLRKVEIRERLIMSFKAGSASQAETRLSQPDIEPIHQTQSSGRGDYRYYYLAAAAVVLLLILFRIPSPTANPNGLSNEEIRNMGDQYGQAFVLSTPFELRVDNALRDSENPIISAGPSNTTTLEEELSFKWESIAGGQDKIELLKVFDNTGREIHRQTEPRSPVVFNKTLSPGVYYWTLEGAEAETWHTGRFVVLPITN